MTTISRKDDPTFWDRCARKYAARPVQDEAAYAHTLDRVRAHISGMDHVLELGCGTGTTALKLAENVNAYTASDLSGEMIAIADEKLVSDPRDHIRFLKSGLSEFHSENGCYDAVLAFSFFHLIDGLDEAIAKACALVKPGGLLISKTVCLGDMNPVFRLIIPVMRFFGKAPYVNFVSAAQVEGAMTRAGLEVVETGLFPKKPPAFFVVARKGKSSA